jgi:hypothetical protein
VLELMLVKERSPSFKVVLFVIERSFPAIVLTVAGVGRNDVVEVPMIASPIVEL